MYCGSGAAGGIGPVAPGTSFAAHGTLVGVDANRDGIIEANEMGFMPDGGRPMPNPDDCHDCVKTVTTYKTVQVPCTRNQYRTVNIKIPKSVPYTAYRPVTKFRTITKQKPKTIYVNVKEQVPYTVQEPYTAYKTITIDQPKTTCTPVTKMIRRRIPVVNVIPQNPGPCPPEPMPQPGVGIPVAPGGAFAARGTLVGKDANYDGVIEPNEMGFIPAGRPHPTPYPDPQPQPVYPQPDPQPQPDCN